MDQNMVKTEGEKINSVDEENDKCFSLGRSTLVSCRFTMNSEAELRSAAQYSHTDTIFTNTHTAEYESVGESSRAVLTQNLCSAAES